MARPNFRQQQLDQLTTETRQRLTAAAAARVAETGGADSLALADALELYGRDLILACNTVDPALFWGTLKRLRALAAQQ